MPKRLDFTLAEPFSLNTIGTKLMKRNALCLVALALGIVGGLRLAKREFKDDDVPLPRPLSRADIAPHGGIQIMATAAPIVHSQGKSATALNQSYRSSEVDVVIENLQISEAERARLLALNRALREANTDVSQALLAKDEPALTPQVEALRSEVTKPFWDEIRALLGQERYESYWAGYQRAGIRPMIETMFAPRLSDGQVQQVIDLALESSKTGLPNPTHQYTLKMVDWDEVAREAAGILTPDQIAEMKRKTKGWWPNRSPQPSPGRG